MKQTKKPTRNQRELLEKLEVNTEGVRIVVDTKDYITVQHKNGHIETFWK